MVARALVMATLLAGCNKSARTACAPGTPSKVELRDGSGQLQLAVKPTPEPGKLDLCDGAGKRTGRIESEPQAISYFDAAGVLQLKLHGDAKTDAEGESVKGAKLRLHVNGEEIRILKPDGIPIGSVVTKDTGTTIYDPASRPVAVVEKRDADQTIRGPDGVTKSYVVPSASPGAAAAFGLDGLSPEERATLYLFWNK